MCAEHEFPLQKNTKQFRERNFDYFYQVHFMSSDFKSNYLSDQSRRLCCEAWKHIRNPEALAVTNLDVSTDLWKAYQVTSTVSGQTVSTATFTLRHFVESLSWARMLLSNKSLILKFKILWYQEIQKYKMVVYVDLWVRIYPDLLFSTWTNPLKKSFEGSEHTSGRSLKSNHCF